MNNYSNSGYNYDNYEEEVNLDLQEVDNVELDSEKIVYGLSV